MDQLNRKSKEETRSAGKFPVIVILENIRSMHNVGSVFRTADAFLIQKIYLSGYTPQPPHRDIQKTALGATESVEWEHVAHTIDIIDNLKKEGYKIWVIEQTNESKMLHEIKEAEKVAVVFGNEVEGVSNDILSKCDAAIQIPQFGMKHSLNVAVAAGIVLWKLTELNIRIPG